MYSGSNADVRDAEELLAIYDHYGQNAAIGSE